MTRNSYRFTFPLFLLALTSCAGSCGGDWKRVADCKGFEECNTKCAAGDGYACAEAGVLLDDGEYVKRDRARAEQTWQRGCELGAARACDRLAARARSKPEGEAEAKELRKRAFAARKTACEQQRIINDCSVLVSDYASGWDSTTKEGQDSERGKKLKTEVLAALEPECASGVAEACTDAGWLIKRAAEGETANLSGARPYYERACRLDKATCWLYGDVLHELKDPHARAVIVEACDADEDGSSCYLPDSPDDVELATKRDAKRRAACAKGSRKACLDLDRVAPDGWAEVRRPEQKTQDAEVAAKLLRAECDGGMGDSCSQLANRLALDVNGKLASGPVLLEIALLEENACKLGESYSCDAEKRQPLIRDVASFYPGKFHRCLRKRSGETACWGVPSDGRVGVPADYQGPWQLNTLALPYPSRDVVLTRQGGCALSDGGPTHCWGGNVVTGKPGSHIPYPVPELSGAQRLTVSDDENELCATFESKTICFGGLHEKRSEFEGVDQVIPLWHADLVRKGDSVIWTQKGLADGRKLAVTGKLGSIDATNNGFCSLGSDGTVACAEVPLGYEPKVAAAELKAVSGVKATQISMSGKHACGLEAAGSVKCWTLPNTDVAQLDGLDDAIELREACAVTKRGLVFCWGGRYDVPFGTAEVMRVSLSNSEAR